MEQPKNIEISNPLSLEFDCFVMKQECLPQSRMTVSQTCDEIDNLDQKCCHMLYLKERRKYVLNEIRK